MTDRRSLTGRPELPVVPLCDMSIGPALEANVARYAKRILAEEPALSATDAFGPLVAAGIGAGPALVYEDHREVPLFVEPEDTHLEYRSILLAGDDDLVVISATPEPAFERYGHEDLRLGCPAVLQLKKPGARILEPLPSLCRRDKQCFDKIVEVARAGGEFNIIPYLSTGHSWVLAQAVAKAASVPVRVAAPPPRLSRRANDKLWFASRIVELLGRQSTPRTSHVFGPAALAAQAAYLAGKYERLVVKVPNSSGSLGNLVLEAADLRGLSLAALRERLIELLRALGWRDTYSVMVELWDTRIVCSPSVQLWIPLMSDAPPIVEGVFVQTVHGPARSFMGAEPADMLSEDMRRRIAREAFLLGRFLQHLGFFGRCSFDALIIGDGVRDEDIHWIECNARWGGVSLPMTLANRLLGDWHRHSLTVVQQVHLHMPPRRFPAVLNTLDDLLYGQAGTEAGIVILSPGGVTRGTGINLMAIGSNAAQAHRLADDAIRRLNTSGLSVAPPDDRAA